MGSLEVKEDMDSSDSKGSEEISESKESEEISKLKKTMESHMIVAALIATVTFAAGFTLPGGYIPDKGISRAWQSYRSLPMAPRARTETWHVTPQDPLQGRDGHFTPQTRRLKV